MTSIPDTAPRDTREFALSDSTRTLLFQVAALKLPAPELEVRFAAPRRWRFDAAWRPQMVALEIQGGTWSGGRHVQPARLAGEYEKLSEAAALGWRVILCTPRQVESGQAVAWVERALR